MPRRRDAARRSHAVQPIIYQIFSPPPDGASLPLERYYDAVPCQMLPAFVALSIIFAAFRYFRHYFHADS
jgi:hypothetical protein